MNRGTGRGSNIKYNPHAFTEQGIYMLMTVLRGELAVRQSRSLIYIVDNYINIKTLRLLQNIKSGVKVTVFSDNLRNQLHLSDSQDFQTEFPSIPVDFIATGGIMHDRFIVLDYGEPEERMFHCGASSKDAAVKLTTAITEIMSGDMKAQIHGLIDRMKQNSVLVLR